MIGINMDRAAEIAHEKRRAARSAEFAPLDAESTIPDRAAAAEAARVLVRAKYADIQLGIDCAANPDELKAALAAFQI